MDLYLMQHGEALPADVDPDRPLSNVGRRNAADVAERAALCGVRIDHVVHSGKLRAEQTATILAEGVGCLDVRRRAGLAPSDPVDAVAGWLAQGAPSSVAIVGHLPFLERLAGLLLAGDPALHPVEFRNAGLVHLVPTLGGSRWAVEWILTPEVSV